MSERIQLRQLTGEAITWDGVNQEAVKTLAGPAFIDVQHSRVLIRVKDGRVIHVQQGDQIVRWDHGEIMTFTHDTYAVITQPES